MPDKKDETGMSTVGNIRGVAKESTTTSSSGSSLWDFILQLFGL
jgi:hypothetical protein